MIATVGSVVAPASAGACSTMMRTDLFFGSAGPAAWQQFLKVVVTPRFPDGLTVLDGHGQFRAMYGIGRETTHVIVIFYRRNGASDARIEAIRSLYRQQFKQASVLRADSTACVSF